MRDFLFDLCSLLLENLNAQAYVLSGHTCRSMKLNQNKDNYISKADEVVISAPFLIYMYRLGKIVDHGKLVDGLKKYFPQKPEDLTEDETDMDSEMIQVLHKEFNTYDRILKLKMV